MKIILIQIIILGVLTGCNNPQSSKEPQNTQVVNKAPESFVKHPQWSKNANIYEVNIRQYTKEGTFKAFEEHLPRLKKMGVDILWIMPIFPISEKNRKGSLGSYYAVSDYKAVNPEFGTMDDLKELVENAHEMGFMVILDWVANHTGWDNVWITEHPEWYTKDSTGKMVSPFDWTDVADLNYENKELWKAMTEALEFWVKEADVDGYRCDVAGMVPTEFWNQARAKLDKIKPVFMLAEAEQTDLQINAFDMTYAWELHHILNQIAKGEENANNIETYFAKQDTTFPKNAYRMNFITNHDENSWNGTVKERMGESAKAFAVLTYTLPGMPLIYSGQEVGLDKRLKFFEKDEIEWDFTSPLIDFYTALNNLKTDNVALWNGEFGGQMKRVRSSDDKSVFAFVREKDGNRIFTIVNLTAKQIKVNLRGNEFTGEFSELFSGNVLMFDTGAEVSLDAWGYRIYIPK